MHELNLATAVCAVLYEGVRQMLVGGGAGLDPSGRLIWRGRAANEGTGGLFGALS